MQIKREYYLNVVWFIQTLHSKLRESSRDLFFRVVVSLQHRSDGADEDDGSDGEVASVTSLPVSPSPGSSVTSSACASPQPSLTQSLLPQHFDSL